MRNICTYLCGSHESYCEDALYADEKFAFILDGATGITPKQITPEATDATWFVREFRAYLMDALYEESSILEIMKRGVEKIARKYLTFEGAKQQEDRPSAVVTVIRERAGNLEYYSLGDSVLIIRKKDGEVLHILDDRLVKIDNGYFEKMKKIAAETGKTIREAFFDVFPYILKNRKKMNTPEGYCALSYKTSGLDTAKTGQIPLDEIEDVLLFSDGFAEIYDLFKIYKTPKEVINAVSKDGIVPQINKLHTAQNADPDCEKFVRNKLCDDISVIYAKI